jgi:parallel beta-helix repeat protein
MRIIRIEVNSVEKLVSYFTIKLCDCYRRAGMQVKQKETVFLIMIAVIFGVCLIINGCSSGGSGGADETKYPEADFVYREDENDDDIEAENIFYVAKNGNNNNSGSETEPWLTIQKAADTLSPGQKVYIKEGVYNEMVKVTKSGNSNGYIIFSAYPDHRVILDGNGIAPLYPSQPVISGLIYVNNADYIKLKGLKIRNSRSCGIYAVNADYITIKDNYIYNTFSSGIGVWLGTNVLIDGNEVVWACNPNNGDLSLTSQECLTVANCKDFEVTNNHIHHSSLIDRQGGEGLQAKQQAIRGKIHHNIVHDLYKVGLYIDAWDRPTHDIEVYDNIVYRCHNYWGMACGAENGGTLENIKFYNNLVYENGAVGIGVEGGWGVNGVHHYFNNIYIYNNTVYNNRYLGLNWGWGIHVNAAEGENIYIKNNICYQNYSDKVTVDQTGAPRNLVIENNLEGPDPLFVNPAGNDFHLRNGSPAIDKASRTTVPDDDFSGAARPKGNGYDIGAFEF